MIFKFFHEKFLDVAFIDVAKSAFELRKEVPRKEAYDLGWAIKVYGRGCGI